MARQQLNSVKQQIRSIKQSMENNQMDEPQSQQVNQIKEFSQTVNPRDEMLGSNLREVRANDAFDTKFVQFQEDSQR